MLTPSGAAAIYSPCSSALLSCTSIGAVRRINRLSAKCRENSFVTKTQHSKRAGGYLLSTRKLRSITLGVSDLCTHLHTLREFLDRYVGSRAKAAERSNLHSPEHLGTLYDGVNSRFVEIPTKDAGHQEKSRSETLRSDGVATKA